MDLLLKVKIYPIFYIFLLKDVKDVNFTEAKRDNIKVKDENYKTKKILNIRKKKGRIK